MKRMISITLCALLSTMLLSACGEKPAEETSSKKEVVSEESSEMDKDSEEEKSEEEETEKEQEDAGAEEKEDAEENIAAGTSKDKAAMIPCGKKVTGTIQEDTEAWYAFTTGMNAGDTYNIKIVNTTPDSNWVKGELYDEEGTRLAYASAEDNGTPATMSMSDLAPNTTYYVCLKPPYRTLDYILTINNLNDSAHIEGQEKSNLEGSIVDGEVIPGSSQDDAILVPLGTKVFGTIKEGEYAWFAFTTGDSADATYNITAVNTTTGSNWLNGELYDEYGTRLAYGNAEDNGAAKTMSMSNLTPNTIYYVRLSPTYCDTGYSLIIKNPVDETSAYRTVGDLSQARGTAISKDGDFVVGTNQSNATLLPLGTKVAGTVKEDAHVWFAFTTNDIEGTEYKITIVNNTPGSNWLKGELYDEYGTRLAYGSAEDNGTAMTMSKKDLTPNTTYYVYMTTPYKNVDYSLVVNASEEKKDDAKARLVFEVPFEINDTQVQFVINQAEFIDEAKAKESLKPVAEAILEHPEHSILLAGTTATDGTQESCVDLSNRRANAVKNLLINTFGVPESQLKTVGLGYEKDPFERGKDKDANGKFVESEGRKNRRVVVLDIDDPIAQELLKTN